MSCWFRFAPLPHQLLTCKLGQLGILHLIAIGLDLQTLAFGEIKGFSLNPQKVKLFSEGAQQPSTFGYLSIGDPSGWVTSIVQPELIVFPSALWESNFVDNPSLAYITPPSLLPSFMSSFLFLPSLLSPPMRPHQKLLLGSAGRVWEL